MSEETKPDAGKSTPPAISFSTFQNFIDQFKEHTLPSQIDKSIMSNLPWGSQNLLIAALKYLGFISDTNVPEPLFKEYVTTDKEARGAIWKRLLDEKYSYLMSVDLGRATTTIVVEKFKTQGITGDTIRKAMSFFINAAKVAGVTVSQHVKLPRPAPGAKKADKGSGGKKTTETEPPQDQNTGGGSGGGGKPERLRYEMLIDILTDEMSDPEKEAVWILIRYLKAQEAKSE